MIRPRIEKLLSSIMEKNGLISSYWNFQIVLSRCLALLSSMKHIYFRLLVKHSLQDYFKKGFSWKLQRLVPAIGANKLVWEDTKMGMSLLIQIAVPSLKGESFLLCVSGASINDKIATDCLKHVKSGTLGGCMICETMLTMFGITIIYETYCFQIVGKTFPAGPFQERSQGEVNFILRSPQKFNGGSRLFRTISFVE
ncbi:hypothetical protein SCA6_000970 [Theobroma cacao]